MIRILTGNKNVYVVCLVGGRRRNMQHLMPSLCQFYNELYILFKVVKP